MDCGYCSYDECNKEVPEMLPGDVVKVRDAVTNQEQFWMVAPGCGGYVWRLEPTTSTDAVCMICDRWRISAIKHQTEIIKVFRPTNAPYTHRELYCIVTDGFFPTIYNKRDVRELTVDEVSELLGYRVKIVGTKED